MFLSWETGFYHHAGKKFGYMWNTLIGERPQWTELTTKTPATDAPVEEISEAVEMVDDRLFPLVEFSSAVYNYYYGKDFA